MDFAYKHSRVKQYLKEGRAFRIETVINKPSDIGVLARLEHLPELIGKAREVNARLLTLERAGQGCAIGDDLFDRLHQPLTEGQRTGAFRFGDPRAMALAGALCCVVNTVTGFTNRSLRGLVAGLLGTDYTANQMSYDLRRLRLHGLIERIPHTNTYRPTPEGIRAAVFYTKVRDRLLGPLLDAGHQPPAPIELRRALTQIDRTLTDYIDHDMAEAGFDLRAKVPPTVRREGRYSKDDFGIDLDAPAVTCPAGQTVTIKYGKDGSGRADFSSHCGGCPRRGACTTAAAGRVVTIHPHERLLQAAKAAQADPGWQAEYRGTRPKVERKIAHITFRQHGGRRARTRGAVRVMTDLVTRAAAVNLGRLATLGVTYDAGWQRAGP